jgi:nucleoid DNA-binding protein
MQKEEFVSALSEKSGYTKEGCNDILNSIIELFHDIVKQRVDLSIRGFGQLQYSTTPEHEGNKPTPGIKGAKTKIMIPETESVNFKLASNIKKLVKRGYQEGEE